MIRDKTVIFQIAPSSVNTTFNSEGFPIIAWTASQTSERANMQTVAGEALIREYGISDANILQIFFVLTNSSAQEGGRVVVEGESFDIHRIAKFSDHWEVVAKRVVG